MNRMLTFLTQRILQGAFVLLVISLIAFLIQDNLGDPLQEMLGQSVSEAERDSLREKLGLNDPLLIQYGRFLKKAVEGDLGTSYHFKQPALQVILEKFPATFELVLGTALLVTMLSIPLGCYCAIRNKSHISRIIMVSSIVGISVPVFLTGIFSIYFFSVRLGWLPSYGRGATVDLFGWESGFLTVDGLRHLVLPCVTLTSIMLPLFIRLVRSEMLETLHKPFIQTAWAKGLRGRRVWFVHAFKNTLLPLVTVGGVQFGSLLAYTVLTETIFQWPGMGFMFLEAVNRVDTPLIVAYLMVVGLIFVTTNTLVDLTYRLINPMAEVE
jgi:peptide/nickel transport system permease protein